MKRPLIIVLLIAHAGLAQVERVGIVGAEPSSAPQVAPVERPGPTAIAPLMGAGAALIVAGIGGGWLWRRWSRLDDTERAFLLLCLRRGVRHKQRRRLRDEAEAKGVAPVAVLMTGGSEAGRRINTATAASG